MCAVRHNDEVAGRFAPSPTGDLHLGNLRTALVAWLAARSSNRSFIVRMEDLDPITSSFDNEVRQLRDLAAIGLEWDGEVVRQSERFELYNVAIERLAAEGLVYRCYCTRREVRAEIDSAVGAPHAHLPDGAYRGTCRDLDDDECDQREASGRLPALRLRTSGETISVCDQLLGMYSGAVDDVVLRRGDGVPAYNLAVVVDDAQQGITQVVRGADILASTPRQVLLQRLLGLATPEYLHVPLVLGDDGHRLAKRHGAVTIRDLADHGWTAADVRAWLARSLNLSSGSERPSVEALLCRFDPVLIPAAPVTCNDLCREQ